MLHSKGFTLIELMIVVVIIGILSAFAMTQYGAYVARAQVAEGLALMGTYRSTVVEFVSINGGACPSNRGASGQTGVYKGKEIDNGSLPRPESIKSNYVDAIIFGYAAPTQSCAIWIKMKPAKVNSEIAGKFTVYRLQPDTQGSWQWECKSQIAQSYLPSGCEGGIAGVSANYQ